jgi:hypothetical protein
VAAGGAEGGRLALDGAPLVGHRLPHLPLGLVLGDALCPPGPPPPVEVSGADPASVRLVSVGPLELRYVRANLEPDARSCRVRVEAVVVNHKPQPVEGNLRATLDHRGDPVSLRGGAAGYRFPPGPSVAVLRLESDTLRRWEPGRPEVYTLLLRVDDQRADSDRASLRLGLKESRWVDGQWWCNSRVLPARPADADPLTTLRAARGTDLVVALGAPVAPALLDEAERLGVAVGIVVPPARGDLLLSERLLHAGRPPVLGVVAGP